MGWRVHSLDDQRLRNDAKTASMSRAGAWSDGAKEWTPEWMAALDAKFGDDGEVSRTSIVAIALR